ncbi:MAG: endolytic transglycosylase MltG [Aquificae bacterium]|nr:endolytic transglycosylase MltG [Aquificota bacterium]
MIRYFLYLTAVLTALGIIFTASVVYQTYQKIPVSRTEVEIKKGMSASQIADLLKEKGIIPNRFVFLVYYKIKGKPIKYGSYTFEGELTVPKVWKILQTGREKPVKFTIYPGDDLFTIGERLEKAGLLTRREFYSYVFNRENLKKHGLEGISFEGYLPPDTYYLPKNKDAERIVSIFLKNFNRKYKPLLNGHSQFTPYQLMIIASMVEKETFLKEEKPIIAGVIVNRLKKGMRLQIDPTVIYALKLAGKWKGRLKKGDTQFPSPYNTYTNWGLPPTPIASFSLETLNGVINYTRTKYLYFYSRDGKKHLFSETYTEHLKNIR